MRKLGVKEEVWFRGLGRGREEGVRVRGGEQLLGSDR